MRIRLLAIVFMLLAAACGGAGAETTEELPGDTAGSSETTAPSNSPDTTGAPDSTEGPTTTPGSATEAPPPEGPVAPAFVTTLADGTQFSLSDHEKPIYMIFWAEW
jgi:hypothetical protein